MKSRRRLRSLRRRGLTAAGVVPTLAALGLVVAPAGAAAQTKSFSYTGSAQSYVVPAGVRSIVVETRGADGANRSCGGYYASSTAELIGYEMRGGLGLEHRAQIPVTPGETLTVSVGGRGNGSTGGFNGGGNGGSGGSGSPPCSGGGGGGASDVRRGLAKLIVSGGGGGACSARYADKGSNGGHSDEDGQDENGPYGGKHGTASAGGAGGAADHATAGTGAAGSLGNGGNGGSGATVSGSPSAGGGGGGGGYYGGGGGGGGLSGCGGGGGGASYLTNEAASLDTQYHWYLRLAEPRMWLGGDPRLLPRYGAVTITAVPTDPGVSPCPPGHTGTPPACVDTTPDLCDPGEIGAPPACVDPNVGECPPGKIGVPPACVEPPPGNRVASDDCTSPTVTTVVDGYFGSLYSRMKVQQAGSEKWICTRIQNEGGNELAGGKLVTDATSTIGQDSNYGACSEQTDNVVQGDHPIRSGHVGDPADPPYVPYLLDVYANDDGAAWVCAQAALGARVMFNGAGTVFEQDATALAVSPPRTPWTPGKASTDCETQSGGSLTKLVNAVVAGTQVWLDAWQAGSKVQLCVRAQGSSSAGGRITLENSGPGATPVLTQGTDTGACTTDVFVDEQDDLYVRRSPTSANPASVCITKGTTSQRFTVGFTGSPGVTPPSWEIDS